MPNVLPTIPNDPPQGIQALLDKVYLWNPDVSNELIEKINALLAKLGDAIGAIRPYSELVVPINQYEPCYYGSGVYVAARELDEIPMEFNEADWILIATKGVTAEEVAQTYLPLSGGTMTGAINFDIDASAYADIPIVNGGSVSGGIIALTCDNKGVPDGGVKVPGRIITSGTVVAAGGFGNKYTPVGAYLNKLNNGADLIVPTEGGTLARIEDINTIGGDGKAGQVLTKTEGGMAWQDAAGGGDYLPLSGGTLTGTLTSDVPDYTNSINLPGFSVQRRGSTVVMAIGSSLELNSGGNSDLSPYLSDTATLGAGDKKWANVYTTKLNNGADIAVPTTGGTMALKEDIDAAVGDISTALTAILGE